MVNMYLFVSVSSFSFFLYSPRASSIIDLRTSVHLFEGLIISFIRFRYLLEVSFQDHKRMAIIMRIIQS